MDLIIHFREKLKKSAPHFPQKNNRKQNKKTAQTKTKQKHNKKNTKKNNKQSKLRIVNQYTGTHKLEYFA